jgi:hypothetical protein
MLRRSCDRAVLVRHTSKFSALKSAETILLIRDLTLPETKKQNRMPLVRSPEKGRRFFPWRKP